MTSHHRYVQIDELVGVGTLGDVAEDLVSHLRTIVAGRQLAQNPRAELLRCQGHRPDHLRFRPGDVI